MPPVYSISDSQENSTTPLTTWYKITPRILSVGSQWVPTTIIAKNIKQLESIFRKQLFLIKVSSMLGQVWHIPSPFKTNPTKPCPSTEPSSVYSQDAHRHISTWAWNTYAPTTSKLPPSHSKKQDKSTLKIRSSILSQELSTTNRKTTDRPRRTINKH